MKVFREVLCPDCRKKYMTYVYDGEHDTIIKLPTGYLYGWTDSCPKCSNNLFVEDKVLEGRRIEEFPLDIIESKMILR